MKQFMKLGLGSAALAAAGCVTASPDRALTATQLACMGKAAAVTEDTACPLARENTLLANRQNELRRNLVRP